MRKIMLLMLVTGFMLSLLSACGGTTATVAEAEEGERESLSIVCTIFPEYDWVRELLGEEREDVTLTLLLENGVDLHSYQPSVEDILTISACDLFIYVGGESDEWVEDVLDEAGNENMLVLNLMELLSDSVLEEETVEGMETEEEDEDEDEEETEYDEHVWLSLRKAAQVCDAICEALSALDAENAALYAENNSAYQQRLSALDAEYTAVCESATQRTLLFGDRFPFRYLVEDYGLSYYAAFSGCSAESEASFETIVFLAQRVDELGLSCVLMLESSDGKIAATIVENTAEGNQQLLVLNSMQAVSAEELENGVSYLSLAEENLAVLAAALN